MRPEDKLVAVFWLDSGAEAEGADEQGSDKSCMHIYKVSKLYYELFTYIPAPE